jgi:Na+/H+ antiporter NhaC
LPDRDTVSDLTFYGGRIGAIAPFLLFLGGVSWLGLSGAPDETGFWPVLLAAIGLGLLLSHDRARYSDAVVDGMSHRIVMLLVLAWILAGVFGTLLRGSGLVESLVWAADTADMSGGGFVAATFLICALFSTATGTSLGTILVCAPLLYPPSGALGADPGFLIGAVLSGATFGDNVSPISDTTIASATTQEADLGGVVRTRLAYALPAAAVAFVVFLALGGSGTRADTVVGAESGPSGLIMLAAPVLVLALLLRRRHLVEGLFAGIGCAVVIGLISRRFGIADLFSIDGENFIASGLLLDGMRRAVGVSIFTLLLMGLVGGVEASGFLRRLIHRIEDRARTAARAEWWIFGSVSAATLLTTHSAVAILTIGPLAREVGSAAGVGPYRRANILDVAVCTYPFLLPFFIPTILAASMTGGFDDLARVSPWEAGLHNVHSWGLFVVLLIAIATGWGRSSGGTDATEATSRLK